MMISILERAIEPRKRLPEGRRPFDNAALWAMILPLLIEQLLQVVVGLADTLMVSYAGEATVSGVSLDAMIYRQHRPKRRRVRRCLFRHLLREASSTYLQ